MRKKIGIILAMVTVLALVFLTGCGDAGTPSDKELSNMDSLFVTGTDGTVAVKESADEDAESKAELNVGTEVKVVEEESAGYTHIYNKDKEVDGYIASYYLTDEEGAVCKGETYYTTKETDLIQTKNDKVQGGKSLKSETKVTVLAKESGDLWRVMTSGGDYGYVNASALSSNGGTDNTDKAKTDGENVTIGKGTTPTNYSEYYAYVNSGFLALRDSKSSADDTIIAKLNTGDSVYVVTAEGTYWYCYSPAHGMYGYINSGYLVPYDFSSAKKANYTVKVEKGYLALRNEQNANANNIIGKLYTGDTVEVYQKDGKYWLVYAPSLGYSGYVNSDYLY